MSIAREEKDAPAASPAPARVLPWLVFLGLGILVAALDLLTKHWAFAALNVAMIRHPLEPGRLFVGPGYRVIDVVPGCFQLEPSLNPGAFSGWFGGFTPVLALISFAALFVIAAFLWTHLRRPEGKDWVFVVGLGLVLGGTAGNFYDRCFIGAVRDFIKWYVVIGGRERVWPNFNIADSGICVGVGLIILHLLRDGRRQRQAAAAKKA